MKRSTQHQTTTLAQIAATRERLNAQMRFRVQIGATRPVHVAGPAGWHR